jgi:hypothetical protein
MVSDSDSSVSIGVCLDHEHGADARSGASADLGEVGAQGVEVYLCPNTVGNHFGRLRIQPRRSNALKVKGGQRGLVEKPEKLKDSWSLVVDKVFSRSHSHSAS